MIRYVLRFPSGVRLNAEQVEMFAAKLKEAANAREFRDMVITDGAELVDMRHRSRVSPLVRRARAVHR